MTEKETLVDSKLTAGVNLLDSQSKEADFLATDGVDGSAKKVINAHTFTPKELRQSSQRARQIARIRKNPELLQARNEMFDEFLAEHPSLAKLSRGELREKMAEHTKSEMKLSRQKLRNHIETFSDSVIAVIITIMLLEIPVPTGNAHYLQFLESVGIFLISFIVIANFWFNHHKNLALTEEMTERMVVMEFVYIGMLSLLPLLTKWLMIAPDWLAALNYGIVILLTLILQEFMSYGIARAKFKKKSKSFAFWRRVWASRLFFSLAVNLVIMGIAIVSPAYGRWLFVIVPIFNFFFRGIGQGGEDFTLDLEGAKVNGRPRF
ncbi:MAG: TMEM175 family protein [Streptococcaceae bacterium]|jgi:uncharacterized membrane protein|nr:TMEM175 family protein [Streptococcaceae bacterium]